MIDAIVTLFESGDIWSILLKVLITALVSAALGYVCTLIGRAIAKNKNSKITRYAKICVRAAEQKFPNEGTKMGPEKMTYVMDQLAIKFPKINENTYLYNIVESAVYELNREKNKQTAIEQFREKYGEDPLAVQDSESTEVNNDVSSNNVETVETSKTSTDADNNTKRLTSF